MNMFRTTLVALLCQVSLLACSETLDDSRSTGSNSSSGWDDTLARPESKQVVRGRVDVSTFPAAATRIELSQAGIIVQSVALAIDGTFLLEVPFGQNYSLHVTGDDSRVTLVFPRSSGDLDTTFDVLAGGSDFEMGAIRYVGDPTLGTFDVVSGRQAKSNSADDAAAVVLGQLFRRGDMKPNRGRRERADDVFANDGWGPLQF